MRPTRAILGPAREGTVRSFVAARLPSRTATFTLQCTFSERTTTMAKKRLTAEQRAALAEVRRELRAVIELLQSKLER